MFQSSRNLHGSISSPLRIDHRRFLNGPEEKLAPISFLVYLLAITFYERETDWPHSEAAAEIMAQLSEDGREEGRREGELEARPVGPGGDSCITSTLVGGSQQNCLNCKVTEGRGRVPKIEK